MSRVIEINKCGECPHCVPHPKGHGVRAFCRHPQIGDKPLKTSEITDQLPEWCPLDDSEDFAESNFNIDRKF